MTTTTTLDAMGRPRVPLEDKRRHVIGTKVSDRERAALDELRRQLGGSIVPRESDALRHLIAEACAARGIPWPEDEEPVREPSVSAEGGPSTPIPHESFTDAPSGGSNAPLGGSVPPDRRTLAGAKRKGG